MTEDALKIVKEHCIKVNEIDATALLTNVKAGKCTDVVVFRWRWVNLILFCICSMSNAFQWIQYAIITNIICFYYEVSEAAVNWTSMVYMLAYIILIFPASWLLDKKGLRFVAILGSFGNCIGASLKCASISPDRFFVTMIGQTICAVSQLCILGIPARLAAVWFGEDQVSVATSLGVFGNQIGVALGFFLTTKIVPSSDSKEFIGQRLSYMFYGVAGITAFIFILIVLFFRKAPPLPPSPAQAALINAPTTAKENYIKSIKNLMLNRNFVLLLITYGVNVGAYYAIGTLLSQVITSYHTNAEDTAGQIGLTIVVAGVLGSIVCGIWLDKTHTFKGTTLVVYVLSLCGMIAFTISLHFLSSDYMWVIYVIAGILGFFMTGYLPIGFEFAAELTYPEPEGTSSGLLNASAQIFGIIFTLGMGAIVTDFTALYGNIAIIVALAVGTLLTAFIKSDLRRQKMSEMSKNTEDSEKRHSEICENGSSLPPSYNEIQADSREVTFSSIVNEIEYIDADCASLESTPS